MSSAPTRTSRSRGRTPARPGKRLLAHDRKLGMRFVAGVDEAGRGSLAGPLVAAAVVLDLDLLVGPEAAALGRLDDSKKLAPDVRAHLYDIVLARARDISVALVPATTIDRVGLHRCNLKAMQRALAGLDMPIQVALVDGFRLDAAHASCGTPLECRQVIKGDSKSAAIAAAAIIAKVTRDRLMERLDAETEHRWAFTDHAGYATELHAERIALHGISHHHRHSYDAMAYQGAAMAQLPPPGSRTVHHLRTPSA